MTNIIDLNVSQDDINPNLLQLVFGCPQEAVIPEARLGALAPDIAWLEENAARGYRLAAFVHELRQWLRSNRQRGRWQDLTVDDIRPILMQVRQQAVAEGESVILEKKSFNNEPMRLPPQEQMTSLLTLAGRQWLDSETLVSRYWSQLPFTMSEIWAVLEAISLDLDLPIGLLRPQDTIDYNLNSTWAYDFCYQMKTNLQAEGSDLPSEPDDEIPIPRRLLDSDPLLINGKIRYLTGHRFWNRTERVTINLHYLMHLFSYILHPVSHTD